MSWAVMRVGACAHRWRVLLLVFGWLRSSQAAVASDPDQLIREGVDLRRRGDDAAALKLFQRAFQMAPSPRATAQMGLAEQALGQWVSAHEHLRAALDAATDTWVVKSQAILREALNHVGDHVGQIEILGGSVGAEVRINGSPRGKLPLPRAIMAPSGTATIDLSVPGFVAAQRTIVVRARTTIRETFDVLVPAAVGRDLAPPGGVQAIPGWLGPGGQPATDPMASPSTGARAGSIPASEPRDTAAAAERGSQGESAAGVDRPGSSLRTQAKWVAWGLGAAGLAVGTIGWIRQDQAGNDFSGGCGLEQGRVVTSPGSSRTVADCQDLKSKVDSNYHLELIGLIGAGVLVATGLALWLTEPGAAGQEVEASALSCAPEVTATRSPRLGCRLIF
jgi:PEGA domain